jgi:hypothetical protein
LEALKKEFPWMTDAASRTNYYIEVNPSDMSAKGRSYVDYKERKIILTQINAAVVAHEVAHLLVAEYFGVAENPVLRGVYPKGPAWIQEGIAIYLEYKVDSSRKDKNLSILKDTPKLLNVEEFESGLGQTNLWYAQSWSILDYLLQKGGKESFVILCECIKEKLPPVITDTTLWNECFNKAYNNITASWGSFYKGWMENIKEN